MQRPSVICSSRRDFLGRLAAAGAAVGRPDAVSPAAAPPLHVACNQYVWQVFYRREDRNLDAHLDAALGEMKHCGIDGFEPSVGSPEQLETLGPLVRKHGLELRSLYVSSVLHDEAQVEKNLLQIVAIGRAARSLGTRILVTNPSPIRWGGPEDKEDRQLTVQAHALEQLGRELRSIGLTLAYHNHDIELRQAAREFHHMMAGTDPTAVSLCLDAHWIYRGAGNSLVALQDITRLYGRRVSELHVRQSRGGVWTEALEDGDVDYPGLAKALTDLGVKPHLVLEQAVEAGTPKTVDVVEAHRRTVAYARRVFAGFA